MNTKRRKAFSLVELLVVIAIISILAGLLLPVLEEALGAARSMTCTNNERQIFLAWSTYGDEFDGQLPLINTRLLWDAPVSSYVGWCVTMAKQLGPAMNQENYSPARIVWDSFLSCPELDTDMPSTVPWKYPAYGMMFYGIGGDTTNGAKEYRRFSQIPRPSEQVAFGDNAGWVNDEVWGKYDLRSGLNTLNLRHSGESNNILFCDGHVEARQADFFNPPWGWWNVAPWGNP